MVAKVYFPGVGYDELGTIASCFLNLVGDDRVSTGGVTAYNQYAVCPFDFVDGIGRRTAAETGGQTGHRWGMSEAGTVVYVVGLHDHASEFLCQIILFVRALG